VNEIGATLHGCIVEDNCLIGIGAQVMDGAKVEKNAMVLPGVFFHAIIFCT
jgi:carbonic anhydrase/acetyltransferase-like protein (isoleucine patch superfamily)